jgi:orotidine-5'-phosphate decarboxylase
MNAHPDSATFAKANVQVIPIKERVILALDVATVDEAEKIVEEVESLVSFFKIGLQLTGGETPVFGRSSNGGFGLGRSKMD